jgi:hypothetical protein
MRVKCTVSWWIRILNCIEEVPQVHFFMYRRPILCTLHGAVDFLKFLKIAVVGGGGGGCYWDIVHILYPCR